MTRRLVACGVALVALLGAPAANADPVTLPPIAPTNSGPIIGGGGGGGIAQQLTSLGRPNVQEVDGSDAVGFINAAATLPNPQLATPFQLLKRALTCQANNAGWGARVFRRNDGLWGGGMVVTSKSNVGNVDALVACEKSNWKRPSAGSETAACNNGWTTPNRGLRDSEAYYIMLAGTADDFCTALNDKYKSNASGWPA
jgi:hypothetical protein